MEKIDLTRDCPWNLKLGGVDAGMIMLPDSTDHAEKGEYNAEKKRNTFTRNYPFHGKADYSREFTVTDDARLYALKIGRTKLTRITLDGEALGECCDILTPQKYELGRLTAGKHRLSVEVDNDIAGRSKLPGAYVPAHVEYSHQCSEDTQTNWNGLLGEISITAHGPMTVEGTVVYIRDGSLYLKIYVKNHTEAAISADFEISIDKTTLCRLNYTASSIIACSGESELDLRLPLSGLDEKLTTRWDEFRHARHELIISIVSSSGERLEDYSETVGFCDFKAENGRFKVNGINAFLRGRHDACVFPLTGYAPMDTESWLEVMGTAKRFGLNHFRFHSWCPPEAAFEAADLLGIYMQPELPQKATLYAPDDPNFDLLANRYALLEGLKILRCYGNHPSFVMLSIGNELNGDRKVYDSIIGEWRKLRPEILYAEGSNNFLSDPSPNPNCDYMTTFRTGQSRNVRGSFAHVDMPLGHIQCGQPSGDTDYLGALDGVKLPVIGHEIGQYQTYPDKNELPLYTGALRPDNLRYAFDGLEKSGISDMSDRFMRSSGRLAFENYRAEIETALRTDGFGGFQLLDLQDFPGQGTALVGMLNSFMQPKPFVDEKLWRGFCAPTVLLGVFGKYCFSSREKLNVEIKLANFGSESYRGEPLTLRLSDDSGVVLKKCFTVNAGRGDLFSIGKTELPLDRFCTPGMLTLSLDMARLHNEYTLYLYKTGAGIQKRGVEFVYPEGIRSFDYSKHKKALVFGGNPGVNSVEGFWASDFWCYPMFLGASKSMKMPEAPGTLGLCIEKTHPALSEFPTGDWSGEQWFNPVTNGRPLILEGTQIRPIVWTIDSMHRNHKLGFIFECEIEGCSVLFCACPLIRHFEHPECEALLRSLVDYMNGGEFGKSLAKLSRDEFIALNS